MLAGFGCQKYAYKKWGLKEDTTGAEFVATNSARRLQLTTSLIFFTESLVTLFLYFFY